MALSTQRRMTKKALRKAEKRGHRRQGVAVAASAAPPIVAATPALSFRLRVTLYLLALALAETVTVLVDTRWGVIGHAAILALLIAQAAVNAYHADPLGAAPRRTIERRQADFLTALALVPLIRIVSLAMPLNEFPELSWYGLIAVPLLAATWAAARACRYAPAAIGLRLDRRPLSLLIQVAVGLSGIGLGYLEYRILDPEPLIDELAPVPLLIAALILLIGTGLTEELIFRGVLQRAGGELFGYPRSILLASVLFAILHVGHRSALDVAFVFVVALGFGAIARRTGSLAGVTIAHGVTNLCLFVLFPHLLGSR